jgi:hypothetical protein
MTRSIFRAPEAAVPSRRYKLKGVSLLWMIVAAWPAFANPLGIVTPDRWQPHAKVGVLDRVTLEIHWLESLEALRETAVLHDVIATDLHAFSILRGNPKTGEYVCEVFVVRMRGALVDNDRTVTFGHEVLHCFGFRHE